MIGEVQIMTTTKCEHNWDLQYKLINQAQTIISPLKCKKLYFQNTVIHSNQVNNPELVILIKENICLGEGYNNLSENKVLNGNNRIPQLNKLTLQENWKNKNSSNNRNHPINTIIKTTRLKRRMQILVAT